MCLNLKEKKLADQGLKCTLLRNNTVEARRHPVVYSTIVWGEKLSNSTLQLGAGVPKKVLPASEVR